MSDMNISITVHAGADLLANTLEDAWIASEQIGDLAEYFRGKLEGMRIPDNDPEACRTFNAALSAMGLISRDAKRMCVYLRHLHEIAETAAQEAREAIA